jgi:hypothetical protein
MKAKIEKKRLVITLPLLTEPRPSKRGKSLLIATSRGKRKVSGMINGSDVFIVASAFIRNQPAQENKRVWPNEDAE